MAPPGKKKRSVSGSAIQKPGGKVRVGAARRTETVDHNDDDDDDNDDARSGAMESEISLESVRQRYVSLLSEEANKSGISSKNVESKFPSAQEKTYLVEVINQLSRESRLILSTLDNQLYYTLVDIERAQKYQGLDVSAKMVLQVIEQAGNKGIWTQDIRQQTNIQQQPLNKIFKHLETRNLIKPFRSVTAKTKKLYMLYELVPAKELTGGVWYNGLEFDHEFISKLREIAMECVKGLNKGQGATLSQIINKMTETKVIKVELTREEMTQVVQTLVYDCLIDEIPTPNGDEIQYVPSGRVSAMSDFELKDALSSDFHFRAIKYDDGVTLGPHEHHYHSA